MARRIFFSYHYERDVWRANIVRNSWVTKGNYIEAGFIDSADFEKAKKQGEQAIKRWINNQLDGTSVTVILIGAETYLRDWVRYEIIKSLDRRNGLLGVYIHNLKDRFGMIDRKGPNPFDYLMLSINSSGRGTYYEWNGYRWILFNKYPSCSISFYDKRYWQKNYQFSKIGFSIYDWVNDDGYNNLSDWIEESAKNAGR